MSDNVSIDLSSLRSTDSLPIRTTTVEQIDLDKVAAHIERAVEGGRYHGPTELMAYLRHKQCLVPVGTEVHATPAGILCFGRNPQAIFPRAVVDLGHYRGIEAVSYEVVHLEKDIGGTVFDQIERTEAYLWANTHHGMTISETSVRRVEIHEYPRVVIRELGVNMLAHRDYTNFLSAARVQLFRNRIEWISPGGLPPGITVENILSAQASRNPVILSILYEAGYVEAFGQGLDTVVTVLDREGMAPPRFEDVGAFFIVTVPGRSPEVFYGEDTYTRLTERQRRILSFIRTRGEVSTRDISLLFDDRFTPRSIQRDMKELLDASLILADGKGRAVRYRLSESRV